PRHVRDLAGHVTVKARLEQPVVDHERHDEHERDRVHRLPDRQRGRFGAIGAAQRATQALHSGTLPVVSEDSKTPRVTEPSAPASGPEGSETAEKKEPESAKQLAAAEAAAKERFEKAMSELREAAYRFSSRARGQ